jgi:biofilm protein TabA
MYRGTPEYSVTLDQNRFLLVFPGEGHLPKLSDRVPMNIDKLVLKIPC